MTAILLTGKATEAGAAGGAVGVAVGWAAGFAGGRWALTEVATATTIKALIGNKKCLIMILSQPQRTHNVSSLWLSVATGLLLMQLPDSWS